MVSSLSGSICVKCTPSMGGQASMSLSCKKPFLWTPSLMSWRVIFLYWIVAYTSCRRIRWVLRQRLTRVNDRLFTTHSLNVMHCARVVIWMSERAEGGIAGKLFTRSSHLQVMGYTSLHLVWCFILKTKSILTFKLFNVSLCKSERVFMYLSPPQLSMFETTWVNEY